MRYPNATIPSAIGSLVSAGWALGHLAVGHYWLSAVFATLTVAYMALCVYSCGIEREST